MLGLFSGALVLFVIVSEVYQNTSSWVGFTVLFLISVLGGLFLYLMMCRLMSWFSQTLIVTAEALVVKRKVGLFTKSIEFKRNEIASLGIQKGIPIRDMNQSNAVG